MRAFPIRNDADLRRALALVRDLWDSEPGSEESELLEVIGTLVEDYESRQPGLPAGDPVETIKYKLGELNWSQNELARQLQVSSGRVSELLARKRPLTLDMVRKISVALGLPAGLLVHDTRTVEDGSVWIMLSDATAARASELAAQRGLSVTEFVEAVIDDFDGAFAMRTPSFGAAPTLRSFPCSYASAAKDAPNLRLFARPQPYEMRRAA